MLFPDLYYKNGSYKHVEPLEDFIIVPSLKGDIEELALHPFPKTICDNEVFHNKKPDVETPGQLNFQHEKTTGPAHFPVEKRLNIYK